MSELHLIESTRGPATAGWRDCRGMSLVEVLVAATLLAVALLSIVNMFALGYSHVTGSGRLTMGLAATRQMFEGMRSLPFDNLSNLDGLDTNNPVTLPANDPEREIARRWRYALAGEGAGWTFTTQEKQRWGTLETDGNSLQAQGQIDVVVQGADLRVVSVTVTAPGVWQPVTLSTIVARW